MPTYKSHDRLGFVERAVITTGKPAAKLKGVARRARYAEGPMPSLGSCLPSAQVGTSLSASEKQHQLALLEDASDEAAWSPEVGDLRAR